jgi:hypothetical protein
MNKMRWVELFEGDSRQLSMRVVCTYIVIITLCSGFLISLSREDGGTAIGIAGILSTMMGVIYGIGKFVDGSVTKAQTTPSPAVTVENVEAVNVNQKTRRKS